MEHKENSLEKKLAIVFAQYPKAENDILYSTSDERIFLSEGYAKSHAFKLKDNKVDEHRRADYSEAKENKKSDQAPAPKKTDTPKAPSNQLDLEREALIVKFTELYGKAPSKSISVKTLKDKVAEKEALLNVQETVTTDENKGDDQGSGSDEEE